VDCPDALDLFGAAAGRRFGGGFAGGAKRDDALVKTPAQEISAGLM
jgi:hypothetical protein